MTRLPDTAFLNPSPLPGYDKATASCTNGHAAESMQHQPPTAPRNSWDAMVQRMKSVFAATVGVRAVHVRRRARSPGA